MFAKIECQWSQVQTQPHLLAVGALHHPRLLILEDAGSVLADGMSELGRVPVRAMTETILSDGPGALWFVASR